MSDVEATLSRLAPLPGGLDRDQLLFLAGQASVSRRGWFWPAAAGVSTTVAAGLALLLAFSPPPLAVERIVYVPAPALLPETPPVREPLPLAAGSTDYLRLRELVIHHGVEALPDPPPDDSPALGHGPGTTPGSIRRSNF